MNREENEDEEREVEEGGGRAGKRIEKRKIGKGLEKKEEI